MMRERGGSTMNENPSVYQMWLACSETRKSGSVTLRQVSAMVPGWPMYKHELSCNISVIEESRREGILEAADDEQVRVVFVAGRDPCLRDDDVGGARDHLLA